MNQADRILSIAQPRTLHFGGGCAGRVVDDLQKRKRVLIIASKSSGAFARSLQAGLADSVIWDRIRGEPTIADFQQCLSAAGDIDAVVGIGGGSVLDVAKLVAAFAGSDQEIRSAFGIGKLAGRRAFLACIPTTAGSGSEVSPNAILIDEQLKKGVISPHLVPDAAYVDPQLMLTVPPDVTAATGIDALTHCIEAYANRFAHPLIDPLALRGITLIRASLLDAVKDGGNLAARTALALGSLYGGMCLGPVNTGAVHALAYPLGSEFHIAHGLSNAVLLTHVLRFNLPAAPDRYAQIALALGESAGGDDLETAQRGLARLDRLCRDCGIPPGIAALQIPQSAIPRLAESAMTITRLLERNVRVVTLADAIEIYRSAF